MTSGRNPTDKEQPNILKHDALSELMEKFPKQLDVMAKLVRDQRKSDGKVSVEAESTNTSEEILKAIADIIKKYRSRYSVPNWAVGLPELVKASKKAQTALESLFDAMNNVCLRTLFEIEDQILLELQLAGHPDTKSFERQSVDGQLKCKSRSNNPSHQRPNGSAGPE